MSMYRRTQTTRKFRREPEKCAELYKKEYDLLRYYVISLKSCTLSDGSDDDFDTKFLESKHLSKIFRQDIYNAALVPRSRVKELVDTVNYVTDYRIKHKGEYPEDIDRYTLIILSKTYYVKVARDSIAELLIALDRRTPIATSDYIYKQLEDIHSMLSNQVELRDWESWHMVHNDEQIDYGHLKYRNMMVRLAKSIDNVKNYDTIDDKSGREEIRSRLVEVMSELDKSRHVDTTNEMFLQYRSPMYLTPPKYFNVK